MNLLRRLLSRRRLETDLEKELAFHIAQRTEELIARGAAPGEAARRVRLEFGSPDEIKEACRDVRGTRWLEDFLQDCRYGLRLLRRSPTFAVVAILSLAVGIGATTAIFSLMDRVMFRTLPVREPNQLVEIGPCCTSYPVVRELSGSLSSFEGLFGQTPMGVLDIAVDGQPETASIDLVSGAYYSVLGVDAALGRTFTKDADRAPGAAPLAVISYRYWQRRFGADPAVIGKTFRRLKTTFTIVGVTPSSFYGATVGQEPDITVPLTMDAEVRGSDPRWPYLEQRDYWWLGVMGRLKPGVSIEQAQRELDAFHGEALTFWRVHMSKFNPGRLQPAANGFDSLRERFSQPLEVLLGTVVLVLLLACANLASLLLAKSSGRRHEIVMRLSIGASRGRIVRQLLVEGLLLALSGGILGVVFAYVFAAALVTMMSNGGPRMLIDVRPDTRVLLFASAVSLTSCLLFGLVPALASSRHQGQSTAPRQTRAGLGKPLLIGQMAIAVLLLIGAGLFGRTLLNVVNAPTGFVADGRVVFSTNLAALGYDSSRMDNLMRQIVSELEAIPGVEAATVSKYPPVSRGRSWQQGLEIEGHPEAGVPSHLNSIAPAFFETYGTPVLAGREFNEQDTAASPRVAIVNERFARRYFSGGSPIGRWVSFRGPEHDTHYTIVGVVKDVKYESLRSDPPVTVYVPFTQVPIGSNSHTFALRVTAGPTPTTADLQQLLRRIDPSLRPVDLARLEDHVARSILPERMLATLAGFFGIFAALLSAIGIYGVMALQLSRRRREIGIRMALGSDARRVVAMVLGQIARLAIAGSLIGAAAALLVARVTRGFLYGLQPDDPITFALAVAVLVGTALAAAYFPGRSAARTNPAETLRAE